MSSYPASELDSIDQDLLPSLDSKPEQLAVNGESRSFWVDATRTALAQRWPRGLAIAEQAMMAYPIDPEMLLLGALPATASGQPERSLALLKRRSVSIVTTTTCIIGR